MPRLLRVDGGSREVASDWIGFTRRWASQKGKPGGVNWFPARPASIGTTAAASPGYVTQPGPAVSAPARGRAPDWQAVRHAVGIRNGKPLLPGNLLSGHGRQRRPPLLTQESGSWR